jgi:DNA-binding NtrC family response regulator
LPALQDGRRDGGQNLFPPDGEATDDFAELLKIKNRIDPGCTYVGQSLAILRVFKKIETFNRDPMKPVLIHGATGTGKTEIARLIHDSSSRKGAKYHREQGTHNRAADFALVMAHWAGIGEGSGLANAPKEKRNGLLHEYRGGTIFLDEVHMASAALQCFLHDVVDVRPIPIALGKPDTFTPDVRMLFGTNVDLDRAVREGRLRPEFYRRIKTRVLQIPPLADRKEDIPLFVEAWREGYRVAPEVLLCLLEYDWPCNVGELRDVLDLAKDEAGRAGAKITLDHLSAPEMAEVVAGVRGLPEGTADKRVFVMLWEMLERQGWRAGGRGHALQTRLAQLLGVSDSTISRRARDCLGVRGAHSLG